jgi:hypothetical protein
MILFHQSLNNFDVAIILLRIKAAYVCTIISLARFNRFFILLFFHFSVRSLSVRSFSLCSFVLARSLFAHVFLSVCLSQDSRLNRKKIIKTFV